MLKYIVLPVVNGQCVASAGTRVGFWELGDLYHSIGNLAVIQILMKGLSEIFQKIYGFDMRRSRSPFEQRAHQVRLFCLFSTPALPNDEATVSGIADLRCPPTFTCPVRPYMGTFPCPALPLHRNIVSGHGRRWRRRRSMRRPPQQRAPDAVAMASIPCCRCASP